VGELKRGDRYNHLTAVGRCARDSSGRTKWSWLCDCGVRCVKSRDKVLAGHTKSCGCLNKPSMLGLKFGRLTVVAGAASRGPGAWWSCSCGCGGKTVAQGGELRRGRKQSCGCLAKELRGKAAQKRSDAVVGLRFARLVVTEADGANVVCRCDCGERVVIKRHRVVGGNTKSCGCLNAGVLREKRDACRRKNLIGTKFNKLTPVSFVGMVGGLATWRCVCDCGKYRTTSMKSLVSGNTTSCGCQRRAALIGRGAQVQAGTIYGHLTAVSQSGQVVTLRCVCGRSYTNKANTLNRGKITSCGCRKTDNSAATNKEKWRKHTLFGVAFTLTELALIAGISTSHMSNRIKLGMTPEQAIAGQSNARTNGWRKRKASRRKSASK
jgi:hypothetical protein